MTYDGMLHKPAVRIALLIAAAILLLMLLPATARSQVSTGPPCGERARVVESLHKHFGERLVGSGLSYAGTVFEVYAGLSGGWTIITTDAGGRSCLVATGEAWESERWRQIES